MSTLTQKVVLPSFLLMPKTENTKLMLVSNPEGEHFVQTYGKILSSSVREFSTKKNPYSYNVLMHSAFESYGSSGGAAYNQKGELVGINIGGSVDIFGNFRKGALVPCEIVNETVNRWQTYFANDVDF